MSTTSYFSIANTKLGIDLDSLVILAFVMFDFSFCCKKARYNPTCGVRCTPERSTSFSNLTEGFDLASNNCTLSTQWGNHLLPLLPQSIVCTCVLMLSASCHFQQ